MDETVAGGRHSRLRDSRGRGSDGTLGHLRSREAHGGVGGSHNVGLHGGSVRLNDRAGGRGVKLLRRVGGLSLHVGNLRGVGNDRGIISLGLS